MNKHGFKTLCMILGIYMMLFLPLQATIDVRADYISGNGIGTEEAVKDSIEDISDKVPEETTEEQSEETTEDSSEEAAEETSEKASEISSEETSEEISEKTEETSEETVITAVLGEEEPLFGYIEMPDQEETEKMELSADGELLLSDLIPASYDSREYGRVTSVKNQKPYGACWSFAVMAALESSLISENTMENPNLSEMHLIRYSYPDENIGDPMGGTNEDSVKYVGSDKMNEGNNALVCYHTLANWKGTVEEGKDPYPGNPKVPKPISMDDAYNKDNVHLQQFYRINVTDTDFVKQAIMEYGAVAGSMGYYDVFYNKNTAAYYANYDRGSNHAVTFVGWDDHYSKENFNEPKEYSDGIVERTLTKPENDGAWLVKNSWGPSWGEDGYFWISYEDYTLGTFSVLVGEKADNYDHNYQYDGSYMNLSVSRSKSICVSNVFKITGSEQYLEAVSFDTPTTQADYKIEIYRNLSNSADPESGTLIPEATTTGKTTFSGYYTVKLPQKIPMIQGNTFAVVVTLERSSGNAGIYAEKSDERKDIKGKVYAQYVATAKENQSFIKKNSVWEDYGRAKNANFRIKAFTSDIPDSEFVNPFADIEKDNPKWKYDAALYAFGNNYMNGKGQTGDGKIIFSPDTLITRSQFVQVLYSVDGRPEVNYKPHFDDVPAGKWFTNPVTWASDNGIVAGKGSVFDVSGVASREQMALIFYKYAIYKKLDVSIDPAGKKPDDFIDKDSISPWAADAMKWALSRGIISGKGSDTAGYRIDPKGNATRAECAAILKKFMDLYE